MQYIGPELDPKEVDITEAGNFRMADRLDFELPLSL